MAAVSRGHGKRTPEYRALRRNIPDINDVIAASGDIHWYAAKLLAANLIGNHAAEVVLGRRKIALANEFSSSVLGQVDVAAEKFDSFVGILEEEPILSTTVKKLKYHVGELMILTHS